MFYAAQMRSANEVVPWNQNTDIVAATDQGGRKRRDGIRQSTGFGERKKLAAYKEDSHQL
jgi:hypothetical protein